MMIYMFVMALASLALAHRNIGEHYRLERRDDPVPCIYLCNCWANPGAFSVVAFFRNCPRTLPIEGAPDDFRYVTYFANYEWEIGGSVEDISGGTFTWSQLQDNTAVDSLAGAGQGSNHTYDILRGNGDPLWSFNNEGIIYNCTIAYKARIDTAIDTANTTIVGSKSGTTSSSPTSTPPPTSTSMPTYIPTPVQALPIGPGKSTPVSTGLSLAAQLCIGIVSGVAAISLVAHVVLLIRRQRRRRSKEGSAKSIQAQAPGFY